MTVTNRTTPEAELPVSGGESLPPVGPTEGEDGDRGPGNDRARLMLLIYDTRGERAVSLDYLRGWTGFSRGRLWRAFEDLEDIGYVELAGEDPRGPVSRWLDERRAAADRVFASTFVLLTDAGHHSPELQTSLAALEDARRGRRRPARAGVSITEGLRRLLRKHTTGR